MVASVEAWVQMAQREHQSKRMPHNGRSHYIRSADEMARAFMVVQRYMTARAG
jgi:hypothetical protein